MVRGGGNKAAIDARVNLLGTHCASAGDPTVRQSSSPPTVAGSSSSGPAPAGNCR